MIDLLSSKELYRIILQIEYISIKELRKVNKWKNNNDKANGLIGMCISLDL